MTNTATLKRRARKTARTRMANEASETLNASDVIAAIVEANDNGSPGKKAAATRLLNRYLDQQEMAGKDRVQTHAAIKAHITRRSKVA